MNERNEHERRDHGQLLADFVLGLRHLCLQVVASSREQVARDIELLGRPDERVVGVAEDPLYRLGKEPMFSDLDASVEDAPHGRTSGRHHPSATQKLVTDLREPTPDVHRLQLSSRSSRSSISAYTVLSNSR